MAGIIGTALGWDKGGNGLYSAWDQNRNAIGSLSRAVVGQGDTVGVLGALAQGAFPGAQVDQAERDKQLALEKEKKAVNATLTYLQSSDPALASLVEAGAISPVDAYRAHTAQQQAGDVGSNNIEINGQLIDKRTGKVLGDYRTEGGARSGTVTYGLTPIFGTDPATGKQGMGVQGSDGSFKLVDTGGFVPMGPGEVAGARATGTVDAKTSGAARAALPAAENAYKMTDQAIADVIANKAGIDEQFGKLFGMIPQQATPAWWGSAKANLRNQVDQLSGQAFLQVRQALKGAGQVTDYEGQKGEIAISQMKAAADSGDEKAFRKALVDFKDAMDNGMRLLRETANGGYASGAPNVTGQTGNQTSTGVTWSFTP